MIISETTIDVATPTGPMRCYQYEPTEPGRPARPLSGLVFYSEIFQQTPPVKRLAMQFASRGYRVLVPEIYHAHEAPGCVLGYDDVSKNRGNALKTIISIGEFDADIATAVDYLQMHPAGTGNVGAVGICLGGHLAFRAALLPKVLATACFYPTDIHSGTLGRTGSDSLERAKEIQGELLMVFGRHDPHIPPAGRRLIHDTLDATNIYYTWHEFNANHAFLRDEGDRHDPATARLALGLAFDLFERCC